MFAAGRAHAFFHRSVSRSFLVAAILAGPLAAWYSGQAAAATQSYTGDLLEMSIIDAGRPTVRVKPSTLNPNAFVNQYYGGSAWGNFVWMNNGASKFTSGYHSGTAMTAVSNVATIGAGGGNITTVTMLGSTGVRLTQVFAHATGTRTLSKTWTLENTGSTTQNDLRFFHGGDTYFGGIDSAFGFYDAANSMVYVRNTDFTNWGLMGFYANPATPASAYHVGNYSVGRALVSAGQLDNSVLSSFTDAGYNLQWNRASLAPGETWTIEAFEVWTPGGGLQVLSPANQNVAANSTATLPFTVQNLSASPVTATLAAASGSGWATTLPGGASITIPANGSQTVNVQVVVPSGASGNSTTTLTATTTGAVSASTTLSVVNLDLTLSPAAIDLGTVAPGALASQTVTATNTGSVSITLGTLTAVAPFGRANDTCSNATLAAGATCTVNVTFQSNTGGSHNGILSFPVVSPALITRTVGVGATVVTAVNGACGSANGASTMNTPAVGLCSPGSASSVVVSSSQFTWTCAGSGGGTTASCVAPRIYDTTPDGFAFAPQTGVAMDTPVTATTTISGLTTTVPISISGGQYSIGCTGVFTSAPGTIANGQSVCVRHVSADRPITSTTTTLTVSTLSATFTSTTRRADPVVELVASANPARLGKPVRLVATVRGSFGSPTGFVTFRAGTSVVIGCERVPVIDEVAECLTQTLPAGRRAIAARYEGNEQYNARESSELMLYVKSFLRSAFRDLQGDGRTDLVLERADGATIARLVYGTSTYQETELLPAGSAWKLTQFADLDGDGKADLVLQNGRGDIETWMMDGTHATLRERIAHEGDGTSVVGVGDFDGDGRDDLLLANANGSLVARMTQKPLAKSATQHALPLNGGTVRFIADFDGDGNDDLLVAEADDTLSVETVGGLTAGKRTKLLPELRASTVTHIGDFDGDGQADLLMRSADGSITLARMDRGLLAQKFVLSGATDWRVALVGDFDGDGGDDLVVTGPAGEVAIWMMDGTTVASRRIVHGPGNFRPWTLGDFDGDGRADILMLGPQNEIVIWVMASDNIAGVWTPHGASAWRVLP